MTFPFPVMIYSPDSTPTTSIWTDFSEYPAGSFMSDWTLQPHTSFPDLYRVEAFGGSISGKAFRCRGVNTLAGYLMPFTWNVVAPVQDVEVLVGCYVAAAHVGGSPVGGALLRQQPGAATPQMYAAFSQNGADIRIESTYFGDMTSQIAAFPWSVGTFYWMRTKIVGTTLQVKVWARGGSEPGSWTDTFISAATPTANLVGIAAFIRDLTDIYFDFFSVSIDGTPAYGPV